MSDASGIPTLAQMREAERNNLACVERLAYIRKIVEENPDLPAENLRETLLSAVEITSLMAEQVAGLNCVLAKFAADRGNN